MAHTFGSSAQFPTVATTTSTSNPLVTSFTCGSGSSVLCVMLIYAGATNRAGGAPTYNGVALQQPDIPRRGAVSPECTAELWYLLNPPTGSALNVSVPNTGALAMKMYMATGMAASGMSSALDVANGAGTTGTNPTVSVTTTVNGDIIFNVVASGAQTWTTSARTGTLIAQGDLGSWGGGSQYFLKSNTGAQAMAWTFATSEDYGIISVAFKELAPSLVIQNASHAHTAVNVVIEAPPAAIDLTIDNASHAHTAGSLTLASVASITVDMGTSHQTMNGWEAVGEAGREDFADWDDYKTSLLDQTADDGINRIKINMRISTEQTAGVPANDNADPFVINSSGFLWTRIDLFADVADMLRDRLVAEGEPCFIVLGYVDFDAGLGFSHSDDAEEYAELMEAAFIHLDATYGWVPDAIEVINEPDHGSNAHWTATKIVNAILATQSRLAGYGWHPRFVVPSVTNASGLVEWWDDMKAVNTTWLQYVDEGSYHRNGSPSNAQLDANRDAVEADGKRLMMAEFIGATHTMLHDDLKRGLVAFEQFTLAFDNTDNGNHYYVVNHTTHAVTQSVELKFLRQYFKYIRSGAVRKGSSTNDPSCDGLAFQNIRGNCSVVVKCTAGGSFNIGGLPAGTYHIRWTTASQYDQAESDQVIGGGGTITTSIPAAGVLTVFADPPPSLVIHNATHAHMAGNLTLTVPAATITVDPNTSIQTIIGWEAVGETGQEDFADYADYKVSLLDQAVADGINRIKINMRANTERQTTPSVAVNDNADPFDINDSGFIWTRVDLFAGVADDIRDRLMAQGETCFIILGYVDFGAGNPFIHANDDEEFAELMEAAFIHLNTTYGWVPDAVEIVLEPDHGSNSHWTATKLVNCLLATQSRLAGHSWNPKFLVPSVTNGQNMATWWADMKAVGTTWLQYVDEASFHRYGSPSQAHLDANQSAAEADGKRLSMLEFADEDADYTLLHADLKNQNIVAYEQFTLAYDNTDNGNHYYVVNHTTHAVTIGSRTRYLRQYFKWIRRGAVRKGTSTDDANFDGLAFCNTGGNYTVVVKCAASGAVDIAGLPAGTYHIRYTTAAATLTDPGDQVITAGQDISTSIPAVGVLTVFADALKLPLLHRAKLTGMGGEIYG